LRSHEPRSIRPARLHRAGNPANRLRFGAAMTPATLDLLTHAGIVAFLLLLKLI
jgi:hypothetical protein